MWSKDLENFLLKIIENEFHSFELKKLRFSPFKIKRKSDENFFSHSNEFYWAPTSLKDLLIAVAIDSFLLPKV